MITIDYDDLSAAFDFVSFAAPMEHRAYVSLNTGAIHWISETDPSDRRTRSIAIPHKNELDLGNNLARRFVEQQLPNRYADVEAFFRQA